MLFHSICWMPSTRFRQPIALRSSLSGKGIALVLARLPIERVDIVVGYSDPAWTIPAWGIGGYAHGKGRSAYGRSSSSAGDADRSEDCVTWSRDAPPGARAMNWFRRNIWEQASDRGDWRSGRSEIGRPAAYAIAVAGDALKQFAARARSEVETKEYDSRAWFYGRSSDPHFPRHGGYSLGYALTKSWLAAEGMTASAAASVPASRLIQAWMSDRIGI